MRKIIYLSLFLFSITLFTAKARAAAPTSTPTASENASEKINSQINELKDKIASRVSELNLVEKRGIIGTVIDASSSKISLTDTSGNTQEVDVDEITKFSSSTTKGTFGVSDITKGTKISVLGLYNKQTKRILARFVQTSIDPIFISGAISELDSKNIMLSMKTSDGKQSKIDVVPSTKILSYSKSGDATKLIFLKLNIGDRIIVVGYPSKTDSTLTQASRIVVLPDLPKDPEIDITIPSPTAEPTAVPAVRKLTVPTSTIKKVTPTIAR